jgi:hypothetical protein
MPTIRWCLAIPKRKEKSKEVCIFATINLGRNGFTVSIADFSGGLAEGIRRGFSKWIETI